MSAIETNQRREGGESWNGNERDLGRLRWEDDIWADTWRQCASEPRDCQQEEHSRQREQPEYHFFSGRPPRYVPARLCSLLGDF